MVINLQDEVPAVEGMLAGVDEAGRGPLVGNVVAAAVILDPENPVDGLNDSKKLSARRREQLADQVRDRAIAWSVVSVDAEQIDRINILQATMLAMQQAVEQLAVQPAHVFIDGNRCPQINRAGNRHRQGRCPHRGNQRRLHPRQGRTRCTDAGAARDISAVRLRQAQGLPDEGAFRSTGRTRTLPTASKKLCAGDGVAVVRDEGRVAR